MNTKSIKRYLTSALIIFYLPALLYSCKIFKDNKTHNSEYQLYQLYYENSSGENGLTTFDYNDEGILEKAIWELADGSRASLNIYKHDVKGNLITKYREFSDGLVSEQTYEYDEKGNLLKEIFERSDDVTGITTYEYDGNGRLEKANCKGLNGWFHGEITYIYDKDGNKQKADINQKGKNTGSISYSYDENGNLIKEKWDFPGNWSQTFIYVYENLKKDKITYYTSSNIFIKNNHGYRIAREYYDYSNKTGGPSYYTYGKNGKLLSKRFERSDNFFTETTYLYDHQGKLTKSYRKYSNGLCAVFTYEFNNPEQLRKRFFKRTDGAAGSESYEYDENSHLSKATWENVDSWLTGNISFEYNENGDIDEGFFKGKKDFNATINFEYDKNENLIVINWNFSNGDTQKYIFEYEKI